MAKETKLMVETQLLNEAKQQFPSTKNMTYTGFVDWVLREIVQGKIKETS